MNGKSNASCIRMIKCIEVENVFTHQKEHEDGGDVEDTLKAPIPDQSNKTEIDFKHFGGITTCKLYRS